jgi:hypothetical protein
VDHLGKIDMADPASTAGLAKLAKTIFTLGLGPLLEPWQRKRLGIADAHNHLRIKLADARAEKHIEAIREGTKTYDPKSGELRDVRTVELQSLTTPDSAGLSTELHQFLLGAHALSEADNVRKALNTTAAINFAADELESTPDTPISDEPVDHDWFIRWRQGAEEVGKVEMQRLWGKLLARETRAPGEFSLQTLGVLRSLSPADAQLIGRLMPFVINSRAVLNDLDCLEKNGLNFDALVLLEGLGTIPTIQPFTSREYKWGVHPKLRAAALDFPGEMGLLVFARDGEDAVKIPDLGLTRVGRDLMKLGEFTDPPMTYIQKAADAFKTTASKVQLGRKTKNSDGTYSLGAIQDL